MSKIGYKPKMGLEAIRILGSNMYSDFSYAVSELVANAHDAEAKSVRIYFEQNNIYILDDGKGMTEEEIDLSYLKIGSNMRDEGDEEKMGRKGIGKLASLFLANSVRVLSKKDGAINGLKLSLDEKELIKIDDLDAFPSITPNAEETAFLKSISNGTLINLVNPENVSPDDLAYKLSDMFSPEKISIFINDKPVDLKRRTMPNIVVGIVTIGDNVVLPDEYERLEVIKTNIRSPEIEGYDDKINGWIVVFSTIEKGILNSFGIKENPDVNKISIFARGKLGLENIIPKIDKSRVSDRYLSGYINADVFEEGDKDMALPNRQGYSEKDIRFKSLIEVLTEATGILSRNRSTFASAKKKKLQEAKEKERIAKESVVRNDAISSIKSELSLNDEQTKKVDKEISGIIKELGIGSSAEPILLVSHSEKDKVPAALVGSILAKIGFVKPENEESGLPKALISSLEGWGIESGTDFWQWVIDNCIKHVSNQPARVLILSSKISNESFSVGVESGIARAAAKNANKRVITVDNTEFKDVKGIFKNSADQTIVPMFSVKGTSEEIKILTDNIYALVKTYDAIDMGKAKIKEIVTETLGEFREKMDEYYSKFENPPLE